MTTCFGSLESFFIETVRFLQVVEGLLLEDYLYPMQDMEDVILFRSS